MSTTKGCVYVYYLPSDGFEWATFLKTKLSEESYGIETSLYNIETLPDDTTSNGVNLVLFSPDVLTIPSLKRLDSLDKQKTMSVLLGIDDADYRQMLSDKNAMNMLEWPLFSTEATENSVRSLLVKIIELYEEAHKEDVEFYTEEDPYDWLPDPRPVVPHQTPSELDEDEGNQVDYDVPPSNNIYAILPQPSENKNNVYLLLDRKPLGSLKVISDLDDTELEIFPVKKEMYRITVKEDDLKFKVVEREQILGTCAINFSGDTFKFSTNSKSKSDKRSKSGNKHAPRISETKSQKSDISESHKEPEESIKSSSSSDLDMLGNLLMKAMDPVCMLCKALRLQEETTEALDEYLAQKCQRMHSLRSLRNMLQGGDHNSSGSSSKDYWPTLLHFAAEYNLYNFCKELLNLPNSLESCNIMNFDKEVPFDIAQHKNHNELAQMLEQFMENQWKGNSPGNTDSGIGPPTPHTSEYMSMKNTKDEKDPPRRPPMPPPKPHHEQGSTYMHMGNVSSSFEEDDDLFGDENVPDTPPVPHRTFKKYVNKQDSLEQDEDYVNPKKQVGTTDEDILMQIGLPAVRQKHALELRKTHMKKAYSESDATSADHLSKLGYDVREENKDLNASQKDQTMQDYIHQEGTPREIRSASEGGAPSLMHKSQSYTYSSSPPPHSVQLPKPAPQKKTFIQKLFHRKNSLATDPGKIIHEEKTEKPHIKRDKKKGKSHHLDVTDSVRISDVSNTSTESSSSTDSQPLSFSADPKHCGQHDDIKDGSEAPRRKNKSPKHPVRRKSKRIVYAEKDKKLRVIDLPSKSNFLPDF